MTSPSTSYFCWICGKGVEINDCKTDEHGKAVHEACYIARIALEKAVYKESDPLPLIA